MTFESWALFVTVGTLASVSPGPNVLIVIVHAIRYGWRNALATIAGNLTCLFAVALLAALGVGAFIKATPIAYTALATLGAAYLIFLGLRSLWGSRHAVSPAGIPTLGDATDVPADRFKLARDAFLVSASNSKSLLFLTAVFPQFIDPAAPIAPQFAVLFATVIGLVGSVHLGYAVLAASFREQLVSPQRRRLMAQVTGVCFVALGLGLLFSHR